MATDYHTNERDYRPGEGAFDNSEYKYQQMERDNDRSEPIGSEASPKRNGNAPTQDQRAMFDRSNDRELDGEGDMYAELGPGEESTDWEKNYNFHPGYVSPNHSPYDMGSQFGGSQTLDSQTFNTTADRMYVRPEDHVGKGPKGYRRSSPRIHEEICEVLMWNEDIDASDIEVKVEDCEVTLSGEVPNHEMKQLTEDLAFAVRGVQNVHNHMRVKMEERGRS